MNDIVLNSINIKWKYIIAYGIVLTILLSTTLIRYNSLQVDMLVSPVLFLVTSFFYQRRFPSSRVYLFPLSIFLIYSVVVLIEYVLSGFKTFNFFSAGFLHFICWILGAALGQFMACNTNKLANRILILAFLFVLIFNKYYGIQYWFDLLEESNNARVKHVENVMVEAPDGKNFPLDSLIGNTKYTLIECWFQQCRPCWVKLEEINNLVQENSRLADKDISIITLNLRTNNDNMRADSALLQRNISFPVYYLNQEDVNRFGITSYPTLLLYKEGELIEKPGSISRVIGLLK
jgi:hypothetical protein